MKQICIRLVLVSCLLVLGGKRFVVFAEALDSTLPPVELSSLNFVNQNISDILMVFAELTGKSIIADESIKGSTSFYFNNVDDIETSFNKFLLLNKLNASVESGITIISKNAAGGIKKQEEKKDFLQYENGSYSLFINQVKLSDCINELFLKAGKEYSLLFKADMMLDKLYFSNKSFDEILKIVLEQGNADYVLRDNIYYITEVQKRDIVKKFKETQLIPLKFISVQEIQNILPHELSAGNFIKVATGTNSLIVTGSSEEIQPIIAFIEKIDSENSNLTRQRFDLKYQNVKDIVPALPQSIHTNAVQIIPGTNSFVTRGTKAQIEELAQYISTIDINETMYPVQLRYIKTEDLLKNLPPSAQNSSVPMLFDSGYPNKVFFKGSAEMYARFTEELKEIDRPKPQLRYELLVIEYTKNKDTKASASLAVEKAKKLGDGNYSLLGNLSNILNINFDVISKFGYQFAASLNMQLSDNTAKVYADTTLHGISGEEIRFQNTDTYRYQELETDSDTGKLIRSGVTREISSGLIVGLNGWVSGDDMITINVNATVSKQNNNGSREGGSSIPSTSERIINTQIRSPSGKPIVLSGLMKETSNARKNGQLFAGDRSISNEKTEVVIYIVPYLVRDTAGNTNLSEELEQYYNKLIGEAK
ncbi:MAG: hypothetical protein LBM77_11670 [Spirochaetaceae bacterium]|jgi:type II secretory pathway component GspD/PulD (secretin)|nr:hypothetical protein [Spirochaetaceae bacterium]